MRNAYLALALAELKATNPDHYARARGIMAAANHLCRPSGTSYVALVVLTDHPGRTEPIR
jgi:hypothetical protein